MKKMGILSAAVFGLMMSAPVAFADDITISVVGPMTGQLATIGDQFKQGATAAADAINAAGGVNGSMIKLDIEDDQCDPKQAVSVANRIVANSVKFIDGHVPYPFDDAGMKRRSPTWKQRRCTVRRRRFCIF